MDILFSPYSLGGLPKSAMAEVEQRTEALLRSSSFQRMLELEKKYKMERLRGAQALLPSPQSPARLKDGPPPRPERPDSLFPQEQFLMVKAARRTVILPSLSVTIPKLSNDDEGRVRSTEGECDQEDEDADIGTPTNCESLQKQVKFLAPEDSDDEEDGMSEQSSICQSPSWEGYGQRKKEKKMEAERRKREKESAEKEARAAKKRSTARLSKPPPPPATSSRDSTSAGLTDAGRSLSDPSLTGRHLAPSAESTDRPDITERAVSADDLAHRQRHRSTATGGLPLLSSSAGLAEGDTKDNSKTSAIPNHVLCDGALKLRQGSHGGTLDGPAPSGQQSSSGPSSRHDARSPRDAFPPSASRTPLLRHMSHAGSSLGNSVSQGTPHSSRSEGLLTRIPAADGARQNGYVLHQRAQAAERAMAGLVDEQLIGNFGQHYPPSRSSSLLSQHTRRPSLTEEAKSAAMKLVGKKAHSATRDYSADQTDYLTFKAIPYSASHTEITASAGRMPSSPRSVGGSSHAYGNERPSPSEQPVILGTDVSEETSTINERPPTAGSWVSSNGPPTSSSAFSNPDKKTHSLKDAAKAVLIMSKASHRPTDSSKAAISVPPYFAIRSRMYSRASAHADHQENAERNATTASVSTLGASSSDQVKSIVPGSQGQAACRVSEGSSSSSAFEDGSPLPSPASTPNTSRPQSAKDVSLTANAPRNETTGLFGLQADEQTLRQSLDSSKSSTPRGDELEARERVEVGSEDRWSRTALPIDMDCDAQSFTTFTTSVSYLDNTDETENAKPKWSSSHQAANEATEFHKPVSKISMQARSAEPVLVIPPRSRKRGHSMSERPSGAAAPSLPVEYGNRDAVTVPIATKLSGEHDAVARLRELSTITSSEGYSAVLAQPQGGESTGTLAERYRKDHPTKQMSLQQSGKEAESAWKWDTEVVREAPGSPKRDRPPGSTVGNGSATISVGSASPRALAADFQIPNNPYLADVPETLKFHEVTGQILASAGPPSPISLPSPIQGVTRPAGQPRANSAPTPPSASTAPSRTSTPSTRSSGITPVSILKQPKTLPPDPASPSAGRPAVLSALPKHMQLQAGISLRPPTVATEARMAPLAKMFVECCSCKFYHDMPSKIYECMAKPDAVVEDRDLGISGNITTMVKCPWCQHNMSRNCCAGYAAVVYLKEKLH